MSEHFDSQVQSTDVQPTERQPDNRARAVAELEGADLLFYLIVKLSVPVAVFLFIVALFMVWLDSGTRYRLGFATPLPDGRLVYPEPIHSSAESFIYLGAMASLAAIVSYLYLRARGITRSIGLEPTYIGGYCRRIGFTLMAILLIPGSVSIYYWNWQWHQTHLTGTVTFNGGNTIFTPANDPNHPQTIPGQSFSFQVSPALTEAQKNASPVNVNRPEAHQLSDTIILGVSGSVDPHSAQQISNYKVDLDDYKVDLDDNVTSNSSSTRTPASLKRVHYDADKKEIHLMLSNRKVGKMVDVRWYHLRDTQGRAIRDSYFLFESTKPGAAF